MCENLKPDRVRCEPCRTINLAKAGSHPKPDMQMYDKCSPAQRIDCPRVAGNIVFSLPTSPTTIAYCCLLSSNSVIWGHGSFPAKTIEDEPSEALGHYSTIHER